MRYEETFAENQQTEMDANSEQENDVKIAVVYFSGTGNTREVASLLTKEALNYNDDNYRATIYTFCTSGGSGIEKSISDLRQLYPDVNFADGKRLNDATETNVKEWIKNLH